MTLLASVTGQGHTYTYERFPISTLRDTHDCSADISEMRLTRLTRHSHGILIERTVRSVCGFR